MQFVAERLKVFLLENVSLPKKPSAGYRGRMQSLGNLGDIAGMLRLPSDQDLFPEQSVSIRQVLQDDDSLWKPEFGAEILLLGDSFTNIYSMPEMNWGEAAGFAEQIGLAMQRPIDRIAQNDAGAHATRQTLAQELARGHRHLDGVKVVVWQFAIRELAVGDWKVIALPETQPAKSDPSDSSSVHGPQLIVRGRIQAIAEVPQPGSVPYRDAITSVHLGDLQVAQGETPGLELVVYLWGMRDNRWTDAARYRIGQDVTLRLTPWVEAQKTYGRYTRVELDDPDFLLIDLPTFWAEEVP